MRVLFLGGRRELLAPTVAEAVGDGVEVDMTSSELGDCIYRGDKSMLGHVQSPSTCVEISWRQDVANVINVRGGLPPKWRIDQQVMKEFY